ncbi:MAG: PIN domain-containing protein [Bacillota bacterium]
MSFVDQAVEIYVQIRAYTVGKGTSIGPDDSIIAATVLANNGMLVSNDERGFDRIDGLEIENWAK